MGAELLVPLAVLALIDSTSFGTLLIPLWLMMAPGRLRLNRIVLFLGTVAAFYLLLGIVLTAGAMAFLATLSETLDNTPARVLQLAVGIMLMILGLTVEPLTKAGKAKRAAKREAKRATSGPGRLTRWRERAMDGEAPPTALVALALTASAIEAASMLPYLGAIGLLSTSDLPLLSSVLVLVGYCLLMIAPALVLLLARVVLHEQISPVLARLESWMVRNSRETTAWILFLLGLYLAGGAAGALDLV